MERGKGFGQEEEEGTLGKSSGADTAGQSDGTMVRELCDGLLCSPVPLGGLTLQNKLWLGDPAPF